MMQIKARKGTLFSLSDDFSGDVTIHRSGSQVKVPFADIRQLVFGYLRGRMVEALRHTNDDGLETMIITEGPVFTRGTS